MIGLAKVELVITDIDGVLTDGCLYYGPSGEESNVFNVRDGIGAAMIKDCGISLVAMSGRRHPAASTRFKELGFTHVFLEVHNKGKAAREVMAELGVHAAATACIGDDINDLPMFAECGLCIATSDGDPVVISNADLKTTARGGHGVLREVAELIFEGKGINRQSWAMSHFAAS